MSKNNIQRIHLLRIRRQSQSLLNVFITLFQFIRQNLVYLHSLQFFKQRLIQKK